MPKTDLIVSVESPDERNPEELARFVAGCLEVGADHEMGEDLTFAVRLYENADETLHGLGDFDGGDGS